MLRLLMRHTTDQRPMARLLGLTGRKWRPGIRPGWGGRRPPARSRAAWRCGILSCSRS